VFSLLQISSFVGRERELVEAGDLLGRTRLLTLTGSGGCGKTRLALAAVDRMSGSFGGGIGWVWLGTVSEEDMAYEALAAAVGARQSPGLTPVAATVEHIGDRTFLLALDDREHLVEACANLVDILLRACPRLKVLVMSRELPNVTGARAQCRP